MEWTKNGWQAGITRRDRVPVQDKLEAEQAAARIGCTVEEAVDAENGLWMLTVSGVVLQRIKREGFWESQGAWCISIEL